MDLTASRAGMSIDNIGHAVIDTHVKTLYLNNVLSPCSSTKWPCFHIVEVSLSLLARASMPLNFWDEAFAAAYLINCTVIKLLDYLFSFEKLSQ